MTIPIIDTHQHLWDLRKVAYPWLVPAYGPLYQTYVPEDLEPQLAPAGVGATVLVQSANSFEDTVYMLDQAGFHPWIAGVVGWLPLLDPEATGEAIERFTRHPLFKGMRHLIHGETDPHWLLQEPVYESLRLLADAGLAFDVVATKHEHMQCVPVIGEKAPNLRMVIDHLAQPPYQNGEPGQWGDDMRRAAENPNVFAKISGAGTASGKWSDWTAEDIRGLVHWSIDVFGAERCMVGGDWPVSVLAGGYGKAFAMYKAVLADRSTDEQTQIYHKTAMAFYGVALPAGETDHA